MFSWEVFSWLEETQGVCITRENFKDYERIAGKGEKGYENSPWVRVMVPRVRYRLELLIIYIHRAIKSYTE